MELAEQIRQRRTERGMSQEDLAERIYVSRQTISNWENDKTYPDVQSLLLLSVLFDTTVDELIKGDVKAMEEIVNSKETYKAMTRWALGRTRRGGGRRRHADRRIWGPGLGIRSVDHHLLFDLGNRHGDARSVRAHQEAL